MLYGKQRIYHLPRDSCKYHCKQKTTLKTKNGLFIQQDPSFSKSIFKIVDLKLMYGERIKTDISTSVFTDS